MKKTSSLFACALTVAVLAAYGAVEDFARYQTILDRAPFGEPPSVGNGVEAAIPVGPPEFVKVLRLCAITESEDEGLRVGIVSVDPKDPKTYLLAVGETSDDGLTVVKADFDAESALLRKDGQEYWINTTGGMSGSGPGEAATDVVPASRPYVSPAATAAAPPIGGAPAAPSVADQRTSYAERLKARREALRMKVVEPPKLSGKDLEQHLKEYQMDLIRQGKPPLPIPLTAEMDDQLVAEGVLPPTEAAANAPASPAAAP